MTTAPSVFLSISILCLSGTILCKHVAQTPNSLLKKEKESAKIGCFHFVKNYDVVQWYKQSQRSKLQFMGYRNIHQDTVEMEFNEKIELDGDGRNNVSLTIKDLELKDSAVYFCAAYYTVISITSDERKNSPNSPMLSSSQHYSDFLLFRSI
ncbi:hypothetical protein DNTS_014417 [Danionella cerebrum]|uniref:Ig-like domain-containing protein n=1 Tax=Danionella cerebrum TaxID=2873325 RepID=A0A553MXI2_9TELE|nr:hypothetical protein DNTS_014417 [Danionella translucida]